jgi:hypothetical protein
LVVEEAAAGDHAAAAKRLEVLAGMDVLAVDTTIEQLTKELVDARLLPSSALADAMHIAIAAIHGVDYLLTWNCRHIANVELYTRVAKHLQERGLKAPVVCNPQELMGDDIYSS